MTKRPTRDEVARLAGVSTATVSHVFTGKLDKLTPETAERVRAAAAELGYYPNALAASLSSGASSLVALVIPDYTNPFFAAMAAALEDEAYRHGLLLLAASFATGDDAKARHYAATFMSLCLKAVVMVGWIDPILSAADLARLERAGTTLVRIDRPGGPVGGNVVLADNEGGAYEGARHLLRHGRRRLLCVAGPAGMAITDERVAGFTRAVAEAGAEAVVRHGGFSRDDGYALVTSALAESQPDAVFVSSDFQAVGALAAIEDAGLAVPRDVAVVSFDGTMLATLTRPRLTTVTQPIAALAREAIGLVVNGETAGRVEVPTRLDRRDSCGCVAD
ncbi:MAG: LacI family transcriptional regulator [Propionibacteriaceae bacterium]|jgi:LacI family transcriptional regulator|nr:LacI family transcriptional regulator [Propionibacteriaceae bacterium]